MQGIMINRKLFGNFVFFSTFAAMYWLFTFSFFAFSLMLDNLQKTKTETKKPYFCRFCRNTSVFVANKTLVFGDLYLYRVIYTPPPRFWHSQGGSALVQKFFIFLFFIFVKYSDFWFPAFLLNFEHFLEHHIYFWFYIRIWAIHFGLFLCVR